MGSYESYQKKWKIKILDKLLWLYLWPALLICLILELKVRLYSWPKRCSLKTGTDVRWYISEWLYSKENSIGRVFEPLGYSDRITPGAGIKDKEIKETEAKLRETAIELLGPEDGGRYPWWGNRKEENEI